MLRRWLILAAVLLPWASLVHAAEQPSYRVSLFNGQNLDGWHVTDCQAGVEDGVLVLQKGNGLVRNDVPYGDFILELEWRPRKEKEYDSGVYFRAALPPAGKQWPAKYQINLKQGDEGNVVRVPAGRSTGLVKPGEWNKFKLTVVGATAALEINGQPAWKIDGIEPAAGYIGFQVEEPLGGQFEIRNVYVTELGFTSLFNGRDFTGWEGGDKDASTCWKVEDETLLCTGKPGTWLRSAEQYDDFTLRLDYKIKAGGNSGVFLRVPKDGNHHGPKSGVEIQVLDDRSERYKELKPYQYCASVYDFAPAKPHVGRPAGEWNSLEIACHGTQYRITHNGVVVVDASEKDFPGLQERLTKGYLGLQNHNEEVWFRNLRIGK